MKKIFIALFMLASSSGFANKCQICHKRNATDLTNVIINQEYSRITFGQLIPCDHIKDSFCRKCMRALIFTQTTNTVLTCCPLCAAEPEPIEPEAGAAE